MNHVYRLVWNYTKRLWQPVSELAAQPRGGAASVGVCGAVRWRLHALAAALGMGLAGWGPAAWAGCTESGSTVTCDTPVSPIAPSYTNPADGLTVRVSANAGVGVPVGAGGTAMALTGKNITVDNAGAIDVFALVNSMSVVSSGLVLGNPLNGGADVGTYSVTNDATGILRGSGSAFYQTQLTDFTGMALSIHNPVGGVTNVINKGKIQAKAVTGGSRESADIPVVAIYGGGLVSMTNASGATIDGRVAFEAPTPGSSGNSFSNAGTINGSVSLGARGRNRFTAESGSSVNAASFSIDGITVASRPGLAFAKPGTVDGGAGGNNSLTFANTANLPVTTDVTGGTYLNFSNLTVTGGTWNLSGGAVAPGASVTLNGGSVQMDGSGVLGTGAITAAGGTIAASTAGVVLNNSFALGTRGLTTAGSNNLTLTGSLTGIGGLTVTGVATTVFLTGGNDYAGGTTVRSGAVLQGDATSLQGDIAADGTVIFSSSANGTYAGMLYGMGDVTKRGTGTLTVSGWLGNTGVTAVEAGTLRLGVHAGLSSMVQMQLNPNAVLDMSTSVDQAIAGLSGSGGRVSLGGNALTLSNVRPASFGGVIEGSGGLIKTGNQTQTLTGANTFTGGVDIRDGTLALGAGGSLAPSSTVKVEAQGVFDLSAASNTQLGALNGSGGAVKLGGNTLTLGAGAYDGVIDGTGGLTKVGGGSLILNGYNTYMGPTQVLGGALVVGKAVGDSGARLGSDVTVGSGASVGGFGQVDGNITVQSGGSLAPGATGGTFTVNGNLTMAQGSQMDYFFGAPAGPNNFGAGHSVQVNGDLALNGVRLNFNDAGGFGAGVYRLFDYTGALTSNNGRFVSSSLAGPTIVILTGSKQIYLYNPGNLALSFWNADGRASSTQLGGGSGTWSRTSANWADAQGSNTGSFLPSNGLAIFGGAAGTVKVDASQGLVGANGMQFISDDYSLNGDTLNLVAPSAGALTTLQVGDGSAQSAGWKATLDNTVAGNGLNKTGAGTLVLNGTNTYAQTRLSAGTLSVSSDDNLGAGGLDFQGGTLRITGTAFQQTNRAIMLGAAGGGLDIADANNTFTVSQSLSGNGGLAKLGAGTLLLTGTNSYLGTTTVAAGRLQVGDGATAGSIAGNADIQTGGTLAFKRSDRVVYGGAISGSGNLRQEGSGTLVLTGNSTFTGITTIASGSLQVGDGGNSGTLGGTVINNGSLTFNRATDSTFAGALAGSGSVFKVGAGTLALTGDSSAFTGTTLMSVGGLQVDGKLGGLVLTTARDNTVSGVGTLNSLMLGGGATLAPGNAATPFGQLNVLGNLSMTPGSSLRVAAAADGQHSAVNVGGVANVAGSVVHMGQNGSYAPSTTYTILTAGGGVQGRFDNITSNLAFLTPSLAYGANKVDLTVQLKDVPNTGNGDGGGTRPIEFADAAVTGNQRAVARALQSLPADSALFRRVLNLPNGAPPDVFDGLSGEAHATTVAVAQGVASSFVQAPMNRLRANLGAGMLPGIPTAQLGLANAAALPQPAAQPLWAQVFGNWTSLGGNGNAARTSQSDSGVSVGGDVAVGGGWRLGGAVGYSNSRSRTGDRASSSQADSYSLTVYGGKAFDAGSAKLNLSLGASYTWHDMKTQRYADAAGLPQTLKADYKGNTSQVFGELGYAMPLTDRVTLEPFVGAGFSSLRTRAFTESGGDAALRGEAGRNNVTTTTLGLHARSAFESAGAQGQLFGTLGWRHAFGDVDPASTMSFVQGGQSFTVNGVPIARDAALVELGVNMAVSKRTTVGVIYGGQFGEGNQQHSGTLDVRYRF